MTSKKEAECRTNYKMCLYSERRDCSPMVRKCLGKKLVKKLEWPESNFWYRVKASYE